MKRLLAAVLLLCVFIVPSLAEITYPLQDAPRLTVWIPMDAGNSQMYNNYGESPVWQEFMRVTGVQIEFQHPAYGAGAEGFSVMMSGDELPDIIINFGAFYPGGLAAAYDDGVIHDLTPYLEEYAPDYYALINSSEDVRKQYYNEDEQVLAFSIYEVEANPISTSVILRADWCAEWGLDPAEMDTYEEIEVYFEKVLENKPGVIPFMPTLMSADGQMAQMWGFDLINRFMAVDGKVEYYANNERYKDWLKLYRDWYQKNYIGVDFATTKGAAARKLFAAGEVACIYLAIGNAYADAQAAGIDIAKGAFWLSEEDMTVHCYYLGADKMGDGEAKSVITTAVDEELLPVICQFMNYAYTDEGGIFTSWGPEGISWDWVDGERKHNDWVLNNPDSTTSVMHNVCRLNYWPRAKYPDAVCNPNVIKNEEVTELRKLYTWMDNFTTDWYISKAVMLTADEGVKRDRLMTDIDTYVNEMMYKFIRGEVDIDAEWENYCKKLVTLGLDEAVEITQDAYDRYLSR